MKLNVGNFQIKEDIVLFGSQNTKIKIESIVQKKHFHEKIDLIYFIFIFN